MCNKSLRSLSSALLNRRRSLAKIPRILAGTAPSVFYRCLSRRKIRQLGRLLTVVEKLVYRNFQLPGHLLQGFNGGNCVAVLDAGDVAAKQAGTLFDFAFGELLCLTHFAEAITNNHGHACPSEISRGIYCARHISNAGFCVKHLVQLDIGEGLPKSGSPRRGAI